MAFIASPVTWQFHTDVQGMCQFRAIVLLPDLLEFEWGSRLSAGIGFWALVPATFPDYTWVVAFYGCSLVAAALHLVRLLLLAPFSHTPFILLSPGHGGRGLRSKVNQVDLPPIPASLAVLRIENPQWVLVCSRSTNTQPYILGFVYIGTFMVCRGARHLLSGCSNVSLPSSPLLSDPGGGGG